MPKSTTVRPHASRRLGTFSERLHRGFSMLAADYSPNDEFPSQDESTEVDRFFGMQLARTEQLLNA